MNKRMLGLVALIGLAVSSVASAYEPIGYPGSTWGQFTAPSSVADNGVEKDNWVYQGKVTQGIDWVAFGNDDQWVLDTYLSAGLIYDRKGLYYNNKFVPAVGVKVSRLFSNGGIDFGAEYANERHFSRTDRNTNIQYESTSDFGVQYYVSYCKCLHAFP